jgi:hypothetical protein
VRQENVQASDAFEIKVARPRQRISEANVFLEILRDGRVIASRRRHNLVVDAGKADMVSRLVVLPTSLYRHMRLGTNGEAPTPEQTSILAFVSGSNRTCESAVMSGDRAAVMTCTWQPADFAATGIQEAGLFDQLGPDGGAMLARVTFEPVSKSLLDTLKITWTVQVS